MNTQAVGCQTPNAQPEAIDVIPSSWTAAAVTYGVWSVAPYSISIPLFAGAAGCWYAMTHKKEVSDAVNNLSAAVCTKTVDALSYAGNKTLEKGSEASLYIASKTWEKGSEAVSYLAGKAVEKSSETISFITNSLTGLAKRISYCEPTTYIRLPVTSGDSPESEKPVKLKQD